MQSRSFFATVTVGKSRMQHAFAAKPALRRLVRFLPFLELVFSKFMPGQGPSLSHQDLPSVCQTLSHAATCYKSELEEAGAAGNSTSTATPSGLVTS